ncbi:hypothetical protein Rhopal_007322-T1 [Rhodotorula paludigena]|uniref:Uncharacterized protein n=1 Tax=Rhodotorula paludigena TaxID=86838 RepID=A0AAV5GVI3_9BASI|nr:hypothetical protein Rhopal_007322-T1 [Rhodotorula paludigena]
MGAFYDEIPDNVVDWINGNETISHMREKGNGRLTVSARAIVWLDIERVGTSCGYSVPYYHYEGERDRLIKFFETKEAVDREFLDAQLASPDPLDPSITLAPADVKNSMRAYWKLKNAESVDGLPGLEAAGWPPEEGAIRKSRKGIAGAFARKTAGGMTALKAREGLEWLRGRDWRVEAALVVGILSGIYIGREYL